MRSLRTTAFLAKENWSRRFQKSLCQQSFKTTQICQNVIFYITGDDRHNFNSVTSIISRTANRLDKIIFDHFSVISKSVLSIIEGHFPAGTSVNTLAQFAQGYNAGKTLKQLMGEIGQMFTLWSKVNEVGNNSAPTITDVSKTCAVTAPVNRRRTT